MSQIIKSLIPAGFVLPRLTGRRVGGTQVGPVIAIAVMLFFLASLGCASAAASEIPQTTSQPSSGGLLTPVQSSPAVAPMEQLPSAASALAPPDPLAVVATTTVLGDLVRNVGGGLVEVTVIVPPGADIHTFRVTPSDSVSIGEASLIVSNGLGLDNSLDGVLASARKRNAVQVVASQGLNAYPLEERSLTGEGGHGPGEESEDEEHGDEEHGDEEHGDREFGHEDECEGEEHGGGRGHEEEGEHNGEDGCEEESLDSEHQDGDEHDHSLGDPHLWLDPILAVHYVEGIRDGLSRADPRNAERYSDNAADYIQQLRDLDREIAGILSVVPPERRHLVTFHDAYGYFGRRYGWQVSAFVPSDASDVTPRAVARVIEEIQAEGIPAVFSEPQFRRDVMEQAVLDTGVNLGTIHSMVSDTVPTYLDLMRTNAKTLAHNLK